MKKRLAKKIVRRWYGYTENQKSKALQRIQIYIATMTVTFKGYGSGDVIQPMPEGWAFTSEAQALIKASGYTE